MVYFCLKSFNNQFMEQLHAHEVLFMMEGNSYSESSLRAAIINKFGSEQRFYACSADNMNVDELIEFLKEKQSLNRYKLFLPEPFKIQKPPYSHEQSGCLPTEGLGIQRY